MLPWSVKQKVTYYLQIWVRYEEHCARDRVYKFEFQMCVCGCVINLQGNALTLPEYCIELYVRV
jgi:hypothetical protein